MNRVPWSMGLLFGILLGPSLTGCGEGGNGSTYVVADSMGVEIVESRGPMWADSALWRLSDEPALEVGTVDGPDVYQFTNVVGAWRAADGALMVVDQPSASIRVYDEDGEFRYSIGRPGEGPGEFEALWGAYPYRGDSVAVWDSRLTRLSVFDADGRLGRTLSVSLDLVQVGEGAASFGRAGVFWGVFDDGSFAFSPPIVAFYDDADDIEFERPTFRLSPEGDSVDVFGPFLGSSMSSMATPFPRLKALAVDGDRLIVGTGEAFEFRVFDRQGSLQQVVRTSHHDPVVDEGSRQAFFEHRRDLAQAVGRPDAEVERELEAVEFPAMAPPYSAVRVDTSGHLWVREYRLSSDRRASAWSIFSPDGMLLGEIETPHGFEVHQIGSDYILGVWRDDLDVPFVRVYSLRRD